MIWWNLNTSLWKKIGIHYVLFSNSEARMFYAGAFLPKSEKNIQVVCLVFGRNFYLLVCNSLKKIVILKIVIILINKMDTITHKTIVLDASFLVKPILKMSGQKPTAVSNYPVWLAEPKTRLLYQERAKRDVLCNIMHPSYSSFAFDRPGCTLRLI